MNKTIPHLLHISPSLGRVGIPLQISHAINYFGAKEVLNVGVQVDFPNVDYLSDGGLFKRFKNYQTCLKDLKP